MSTHHPVSPAIPTKTPFFAAAVFFAALAALVAWLGIAPLGAAELLGISACAAAAGSALAFPFAVDFVRQLKTDQPPLAAAPSAEALAAHIAELLEEKRQSELHAALAATPTRRIDTDSVASTAGAKPRLGRGLLGLMHDPAAITPPASTAPSARD